MKTRLFLDLPRISHLCHMSQRITNQLSSFHLSIMIQQSAAIQESLKSLNFITKGAVDMLDQPCASCTVQRATRRWTMVKFYGMINIAAINALVIYVHNMCKDQPENKINRKYFCSQLHMI